MEFEGKAILALPKRQGVSQRTGNPWCTREYVLETQEQYSKKICFEVSGEDKMREFNIHSNDLIRVYADVVSREYQGRWYTSVKAWKVEHIGNASPTSQPAQQQSYAPQPTNSYEDSNEPF